MLFPICTVVVAIAGSFFILHVYMKYYKNYKIVSWLSLCLTLMPWLRGLMVLLKSILKHSLVFLQEIMGSSVTLGFGRIL